MTKTIEPRLFSTASRLRLPQAILVSLGLHALVLAPWSITLPIAGQRETVLTVRLQAPEPVAAQPLKRVARPAVRKQTKTADASPARVARERAPLPTPPSQAVVERQTQSETTPSPASSETLRAQVEALLLTDLRRHFEYPPLARQRDWQGVVWLSVTVRPDGWVGDIRVDRSSGYAVLDRSAVASMRRVGQLAEAAHWLNGRALQLPLPIVYRLTN